MFGNIGSEIPGDASHQLIRKMAISRDRAVQHCLSIIEETRLKEKIQISLTILEWKVTQDFRAFAEITSLRDRAKMFCARMRKQNSRRRSGSYIEDDFVTKTKRRAFAADRSRWLFLQEALLLRKYLRKSQRISCGLRKQDLHGCFGYSVIVLCLFQQPWRYNTIFMIF